MTSSLLPKLAYSRTVLCVKKVYPDLKIMTPWAAHIGIGFLDWEWEKKEKQTTRKVHSKLHPSLE